ncbi:dinitrogenase iron-molybdenum cofactor [bacterium BMS3Abin12]|nr:dinitrogenase iron-molybdenum cofactor [bacterium BMS3Abin12]HDJ86584.1 nitrogen fixation protein [Chromatiales bacterium]HDO34140.1 nitrogen fixation protein [Chromatiales bacterium]
MKIAVASQNRRNVTDHTGRCRRFWVYEIEHGRIVRKDLRELPISGSLHETPAGAPHALDDADVLIAGGMGMGVRRKLDARGITGVVTAGADPDAAVAAYLAGTPTLTSTVDRGCTCYEYPERA